jgi:uncharacterized protein (DUF58 family)
MPFRDVWVIVGGLLVVVGFAASEPVIAAVGFAVMIVGGLSRYWSRHLFDRTSLRPKLAESRAFPDEAVGLEVTLENRKVLPLPWYEWRLGLADALRVKDEAMASSAVPGLNWLYRRGSMGWYGRRSWSFSMSGTERGYHQVGPSTLRSSDLLGVFPRRTELPGVEHLVVYPRVSSLDDLLLPADRPFGGRRGGTPISEDPLRIAGLREYRPGDPLKRIDWKATARTGELTSRVYEPAATHQLYICLNIDTLEHAWEGYLKEELERAIEVAASVAVWAASQRFAVGLLANGSYPDADRPIRLPPSRSREQVTRILEALAVIQPLTMGDMAGTLMRETGRLPAGSTIILVASLVPEALAGALLRFHQEGHRVFVLGTSERVAGSVPAEIPLQMSITASRPAWSAS